MTASIIDDSHHTAAALRLLEESKTLYREHKLEEAEELCRLALKYSEDHLGRKHCTTGHVLDHLSIILSVQEDKHVAARLACEEAVEILNRELGHDDSVVQNLIGRLHHHYR